MWLPPKKLSQIYYSYLSANKFIRSLLPLLRPHLAIKHLAVVPQLESLIEEIGRFFQVDNLLGDLKDILQPTDDLINLLVQQQALKDQLTEWAEQTSNVVFQDTISIKAEYFSKEGYAFSILSKKLAKLNNVKFPASSANRIDINSIIILGKRGNYNIIY